MKRRAQCPFHSFCGEHALPLDPSPHGINGGAFSKHPPLEHEHAEPCTCLLFKSDSIFGCSGKQRSYFFFTMEYVLVPFHGLRIRSDVRWYLLMLNHHIISNNFRLLQQTSFFARIAQNPRLSVCQNDAVNSEYPDGCSVAFVVTFAIHNQP